MRLNEKKSSVGTQNLQDRNQFIMLAQFSQNSS